MLRTLTDTDRLIKYFEVMAPCTHPGIKRLFCLQVKNGLGRFAPSALPHYTTPPLKRAGFLDNGESEECTVAAERHTSTERFTTTGGISFFFFFNPPVDG